MKDGCLIRNERITSTIGVGTNRKSIWEIPDRYHVSILALCLNDKEIEQVKIAEDVSDNHKCCRYDVLHRVARTISEKTQEAVALQSFLDNKYRFSLARFEHGKSLEELQRLWETCVNGGEFRGAYWAAMTHPLATSGLQEKLYGQLSVLSLQNCCLHLRQKLQNGALQHKIEKMGATLAQQEKQHSATLCRYCRKISQLQDDLSSARYSMDRLQRHLELMKHRNALLEKP